MHDFALTVGTSMQAKQFIHVQVKYQEFLQMFMFFIHRRRKVKNIGGGGGGKGRGQFSSRHMTSY